MTKVRYNIDTMKFISVFESVTGAGLKDCFLQESRIMFIVKQGLIAQALGKKGINIRKLEKLLNKRIKIIEFNSDVLQFVKNIVYPSKIKDMSEEDGIITIIPIDSSTRGYLIGRAAVNLRNTEAIVKRYFKDIGEIKVI